MFTTVVVVIFRHVVEIVDLIVCDISQPAASFPSSIVLLHTGRRKKWWNGGARSREKGSNGSWHGKKVHQHYASCQADAGVEFHIIGASSLWETKSYTNALLHQLYGASKIRCRGYIFQLAWERFSVPGWAGRGGLAEGSLGFSARTAAPMIRTQIRSRKRMDGFFGGSKAHPSCLLQKMTTQIKSLSSYIFLRPMKLSLCVCVHR